MSTHETFDAIVVGSGATGGVAAKQLCEAGLSVLVLEAGPALDPARVYGSQAKSLSKRLYRHFVTRRQTVQERHVAYWELDPDLFADDVDHPYSAPPGKPYRWIRGRQLGGRSLTWGGVTLRFSDFEFRAASRDGHEHAWPIGYADLVPYYAALERFLGTHGSKEGLPQLPDGVFREPHALTPGEQAFRVGVESKLPGRRVIISRGIFSRRRPERGQRFPRLSSPGTTLLAAQRTGRLTVQSDAAVSLVLLDRNTGRAVGVEYVDRATRTAREARARIVFLCASTIESLRILMNSKSSAFPEGIGASSGVLGRYVMDHIVSGACFYLPDVPDDGRGGYELLGSDSMLIPRYQNLGAAREPYLRGFGMWGGIQRIPLPMFLRKKRGVAIGFLCAMGEALPDHANHVRLDETLKDASGIPVPHVSCTWTGNDLKLAAAMRAALSELVEAGGGVMSSLTDLVRTPLMSRFVAGMQEEWTQTTPGLFVHEVGGARMGTHPKDSVVNPFCQCWDVKNLFVSDGACWVSSGWQNPTLTEMAITARACDYAVGELRRQNL